MVRKFPTLQNPRSLLWSQEPITCPHSEPYEPSSHSPSLFLSDPFKYYPLTMPKSWKLYFFLGFATTTMSTFFLSQVCRIVPQCEVCWSDHSSMPHSPSVWGMLIWSLQYATWSISVRYLDLVTPVCHMVHQCEVPWSDHSSMPHGPSVCGTVIWSLQYATWSISVRYCNLIIPVCHMVHQSEVLWSDHSSMPHGPSVCGTLIWSLQYATWSISARYLDLITPVVFGEQ